MFVSPPTIAASTPVPVVVKDQRPVADAAALARDPTPLVPLPIPPQYTQKGAIARAQLTDTARDGTTVERVLKPYGVAMLPRGQSDSTGQPDTSGDPKDTTAQSPDIASGNSGADPGPLSPGNGPTSLPG